jgi:hypothetical protein
VSQVVVFGYIRKGYVLVELKPRQLQSRSGEGSPVGNKGRSRYLMLSDSCNSDILMDALSSGFARTTGRTEYGAPYGVSSSI